MGAGGVEAGIAAGRDMDHRRDVPLDHFLVDRIPPAVGQRRARPPAAGRIGVEIDRHEPIVPHAFVELGNAGLGLDAGALRQHGRADEIVGEELRDPEAQLVADRGPGRADGEVADVMGHEAGAGAENREIAAARLHQLELVRFDQLAKLIIADLEFSDLGRLGGVLDPGDLPVAPRLERLGGGGVVAVAVDDHGHASCRANGSAGRFRRQTFHDQSERHGIEEMRHEAADDDVRIEVVRMVRGNERDRRMHHDP